MDEFDQQQQYVMDELVQQQQHAAMTTMMKSKQTNGTAAQGRTGSSSESSSSRRRSIFLRLPPRPLVLCGFVPRFSFLLLVSKGSVVRGIVAAVARPRRRLALSETRMK